jgi:hypothetical protein
VRRLADHLDGGQQQADQDGDDRDHHQQLDQRERGPPARQGTRQGRGMPHGKLPNNGKKMRRESTPAPAGIRGGDCETREAFNFLLCRPPQLLTKFSSFFSAAMR